MEKNKQRELLASGNYSELKSRLLFVLGALLVFRLGTFIPVPGIDPGALAVMFEQQKGTILDMFNMLRFVGHVFRRVPIRSDCFFWNVFCICTVLLLLFCLCQWQRC